MEKYTIFYRQENNTYQKFDFGSLRDYLLNSKLLTTEQKTNLSNFFNYTEPNLLDSLTKRSSDTVILPTEILEKYPKDILSKYITSKASGVGIIEGVNFKDINFEIIEPVKLIEKLEITSECQIDKFYEFGFERNEKNTKIFNELKELLKENPFTNVVDNQNGGYIFFTNEKLFIDALEKKAPKTTVNSCNILPRVDWKKK
jgi:hypothetical protein